MCRTGHLSAQANRLPPPEPFPKAAMYICNGHRIIWEHTRALIWKALVESSCGWGTSGCPEACEQQLLHHAARDRLKFGLDHFVERPEIFAVALGKAAMHFDGRKQLVAVHIQSQRSKLFTGISFDAPFAAKTAPHHLTEVTA